MPTDRCPVCRNTGPNRTCHPAEDAVSRRNLPDGDPRATAAPTPRRAALLEVLNRELPPGEKMHGWRCEHPDRWPGPCDCADTMADLIEAALAAARPVPDGALREAPLPWTRHGAYGQFIRDANGRDVASVPFTTGDERGPSDEADFARAIGLAEFIVQAAARAADTSAEPGPAQSGPEPEQGPSPGSAHPDPVAAALAVARHFDGEAFACDFGGRTAINLPNLEQVIPLTTQEVIPHG